MSEVLKGVIHMSVNIDETLRTRLDKAIEKAGTKSKSEFLRSAIEEKCSTIEKA